MKIVADENIPYVREVFTPLGEVICISGRNMNPALLLDADVLLVRSITPVNQDLLQDTSVRFVGTATIGTDHIDQEYLHRRGITFVSAAGSNANSVTEYVLTALLVLAARYRLNLEGKKLGIIGVGNIGSRLEKKAGALGLQVLPNDPPLQRQTGAPRFVALDQVLQEADIITCHVPLTRVGPDPTYHLLEAKRLAQLKPDAILINTSRGAVVDNRALKEYLHQPQAGPVVLDVWENEPHIDVELLEKVSLATPHIAGYSLDGKVNGTLMLYKALCVFLGEAPVKQVNLMPPPPLPAIDRIDTSVPDQAVMTGVMGSIYDIDADDRNLRGLVNLPVDQRGQHFDSLRKNYPVRRESHNTRINPPLPRSLQEKLTLLGFAVS